MLSDVLLLELVQYCVENTPDRGKLAGFLWLFK